LGFILQPNLQLFQADRFCDWVSFFNPTYNYFSCGVAASETIQVPSGSISLDATQYLRTGDISTRSRTAQGGNVAIQASDAIVGVIDTSGARWFGGNVSVKTDVPFKHGAITTDGEWHKGKVSIGPLDTSTAGSGQGGTVVATPQIDEIAKPNVIQHRILVFTEAQRLAGQKLTAQEIAEQLNIPLEIAQIAVLNPAGDNIKVAVPDLSGLYRGTLYAGDSFDTGIFCEDLCKVVVGGVIWAGGLTIKAATDLFNHIFQAKTHNGDMGDDQSKNDQGKKIDPDKTIEQQLRGKGQLRDLKRSKNWKEKISVDEAVQKKIGELREMVRNGELSKKGLRQIEKAFEGRDLGKRGK
jgi:hypothetical protein